MKSSSLLVAKAILFDDNHKILVLSRSNTHPTSAGRSDLPGGEVDEGEGPDEAIVREIDEETGLKLQIDKLTMSYTTTTYYENRSIIRFLYVGIVGKVDEIKLSSEHSEYVWLSIDDMLEKFNHPTYANGLRYLKEHNLLPKQLHIG